MKKEHILVVEVITYSCNFLMPRSSQGGVPPSTTSPVGRVLRLLAHVVVLFLHPILTAVIRLRVLLASVGVPRKDKD